MPIEKFAGGTIVTGAEIELVSLLAQRGALQLEIKGFRSRGQSVSAMLKQFHGWKGRPEKVLEQLEAYTIQKFPNAARLFQEEKEGKR